MAVLKALRPFSIALVFVVFHLGQACKLWQTQRCPSYYLIARVNLLAFIPEYELENFCGQIQKALQCVYTRGYMSGCGATAMLPFDTMTDSANALCIHRTEEYRQSAACFTQKGISDRVSRNCMVQMTNYTQLVQDPCGLLTWVPNCAKDVIAMTDGCSPRDALLMRDLVRIYLNATRKAFYKRCPDSGNKEMHPSPEQSQNPTKMVSTSTKVQVSTVQSGKKRGKVRHDIEDGLTDHSSLETDSSSHSLQSSTSTQASIPTRMIESVTTESSDEKPDRLMTSQSPERSTIPQTANVTRDATRTTNTEASKELGITGGVMSLESKSGNRASTVYLGSTTLLFQFLLLLLLLWPWS